MRHREKRERLLVGLYLATRSRGLSRYYDLRQVADDIGLERREGELRTIVNDLHVSGLVEASFTMGGGHEGGLSALLTGYGVEQAEELLDEHPEYATNVTGASAPASDRYVSLSDNERDGITADLEELQSAVERSNEGTEEDRLIALSEIAVFEAAIAQPKIASDLIDRFAKIILNWLVRVFGAAVVGAAATLLIERLASSIAAA